MHQTLIAFNKAQRRTDFPELRSGDVIRVSRKIKEGNKERLQAFEGIVIAIKGGQSASRTVTVRKVSNGVGVELILPLNSPQIEKIEVVKHTRTRRAKLYYIRTKSAKVIGKKLKEVARATAIVPAAEETASVEPEEEATESEQTEKPAETAEEPKA